MKANTLITRALRLINVPGRGASLSSRDLSAGFDALQELIDSLATDSLFIPGIRRHFFTLTSGKSIYTYGADSALDLRSDDFDGDPHPIKIEGGYIRSGSTITDNEQVNEYRLENAGTWSVTGGASIGNNKATLAGISTLIQSLTLTAGTTYRLKLDVEVSVGDVVLEVEEGGTDVLNIPISATDEYEYDFVYTSGAVELKFTTDEASDSVVINSASIIERGKDRLELPDLPNSDYPLRIIEQTTYNRMFSKGNGGRASELLYSREYDRGEIRLDNSSTTGDILVIDVLVNKVAITRQESNIRLNPEAIRFLRYALANELAAEFGKELTRSQMSILRDAERSMESANDRMNPLRVDAGLLNKTGYNIDRGDY